MSSQCGFKQVISDPTHILEISSPCIDLIFTMLSDKKVPCIPPVFHDNKFVTDFGKKANLFNSFFAKQCSIIENNSVLSSSTIPITDQFLANIEFTKDDVKIIICKLDPNSSWSWYDQYLHGENVRRCYNRTSFQNIQKLLKMWNISRWLEERKHWTNFLKKATKKHQKLLPSLSCSNL